METNATAARHPPALDDASLGSSALSFALQARQFSTMAALAARLHEALAPLGMTAAASGFVSGPRAASANPFHFTNWPPDWVALYMAEDFILADPLPRWARRSGRAITWSALFELLPSRDPGRRVIEAATRFGYTEGMAIPLRSAAGALGLVAFGGGRSPLTDIEQITLTFLGHTAFEAAERIESPNELKIPPILTAREIECLMLVAHGHSDRRIGTLLGVTEPTVRFHIGNAKTKLSASSRTHLAALAVTFGYTSL